MTASFIFAFREFFEVFLIIGVFFGMSKKLRLHREKEIALATFIGLAISLLLPIMTFVLGEKARVVFNERNADLLEGYLMIFSGIFIVYVVISLHSFFVRKRAVSLIKAHQKLENNIFDVSLFVTIVFFVVREGFEIALFTATTSLFATFAQNIGGLFMGFATASIVGLMTYTAYLKFSITQLYQLTEYMIIFLGATLVKNGIGELTHVYFQLNFEKIMPLFLAPIPDTSTFIGSLIHNLFGIKQHTGIIEIALLAGYIIFVHSLLKIRGKKSFSNKK